MLVRHDVFVGGFMDFARNKMFFQDLVKGSYGRKIAYTDAEKITAENVVRVIGKCIGAFTRIELQSDTCGGISKETSLFCTEQRSAMRIL